jgi:adenylate kinase
MRMILLGAPGSGKGTQGERIASKYRIPQVSTGDLLRAAIRNGTDLGKKANEYMSKGSLVPDTLILELTGRRLQEADCKNGYILDGFPRTIGQAKGLSDMLAKLGDKIDVVLNIVVTEKEVLKRLGGRRQCTKCSAVYHKEFSPPKKDGVCDKCNSPLYQRDDDKEETIKNRLKVYKEQTAPLIDFYKATVKNVDGSKDPAKVFEEVCSLIS